MGNSRNRSRKRVKITPRKPAKKFKYGDDHVENTCPSGVEIGDQSADYGVERDHIDSIKEGTIFIDLSVLFGVFEDVLKCPECGDDTTAHIDLNKKHGFSQYVVLDCRDPRCDWKHCFHTSKKHGRSFEINVRSVLAFREIGKGHNAMQTFAKVMNMPPPPTRKNFTKIQNKQLFPIIEQLANDSMTTNAFKVKEACGNDEGECGISLDGTWQKRGHASHNGVVTAISLSTKKCVDVEVLSDKCKEFKKWKKKQSDPRYEVWKANHLCKINHSGSSNSMETVGAVRIFERSVATRGLKYIHMLGDGDSSTYNNIVDRKPYGDELIPNKLECIGHVQKRVGSRLRRLKNANKGVKLQDGKGLAGKGRLTDGKIDILQNYYGLAVRNNLNDVEKMARDIKASLYHVASTDANPQHQLCPDGENSWCQYKVSPETYKHKNGLAKCIVELIEPVFDSLCDQRLLEKCMHGLTQNVNECLNGLIWERCPKSTYAEKETVALATYLAVLKFNDGDIFFIKIFEDLNITPGKFSLEATKVSSSIETNVPQNRKQKQ
ncbi:LOW QUALITY PROTEIN: uncharacterized protein LOC124438534 [Xenia sp. Carnegie-2017]|uniref:LOW QUALITY PROTEIN: uncharacterized protein LOC124438534 n=1 Tax=Xenia sp. Carnegie-2017 TaxID=2897299 RepID=UPI001F040991|nr:LOW QUALITY PROTEIN: uncharacterized protein LOC124438534 [Xenia sp. Carnegie-2017]